MSIKQVRPHGSTVLHLVLAECESKFHALSIVYTLVTELGNI